MKIVATILAVESRREFAEKLRDRVAEHMPVQMSCEPNARSLENAFLRSKTLMDFATLQKADWHLYLEDDQELTDEFFKILPTLTVDKGVDLWYLANREIPIGQLGWRNGLRVNQIRQPVAGSHGLLYQTKHIPSLLLDFVCRPIDYWFWHNIDPHQNTLIQIISPVCAIHRGQESTLHEYPNGEHMFTYPNNI